MDELNREEREEMRKQAFRYEEAKRTGKKVWFDSDNYIDIADWYNINGNYDAVSEVLSEAYNFYPDNEEIISMYAVTLANAGNYTDAINLTKKAIELSNSDDFRIDLASLYIDSGKNYDEALDLLFDVLKREDDDYFVYLLLGRIYLEKEAYKVAESYLRKGVTLNNTDKAVLGCYADCAFDDSLDDTMIRFLYEQTHNNPFNDLLWTTLGVVYSRFEYIQEAIEAFDYAIALKPEGEIRHSCKADCFIANKDYASAELELNTALKYSQTDSKELHLILAGVLMQENKYAEALLHLKNLDARRDKDADHSYLLDMAMCYYFLHQPNFALMKIEQAISANIAPEIIVDFARRVYDYGFKIESEDIFEAILTSKDVDSYFVELASVTFAALKSKEGNTFEAIRIMENALDELHSCTEDFWYAFLRITCQDEIYDGYTTQALKLLTSLDSFPVYLKEHYPEVIDNPNYKRCLKKIYHV